VDGGTSSARARSAATDGSAPRRLRRRSRRETRELLLTAGALLADQRVRRDDDDLLAAWLSDVRFDEVLKVGKQLQLYLEDHADSLERALEGVTDPRVSDRIRRTWFRDRCDAVLATDASGYRDIAKSTAYTVFEHERDYREQLARELLAADRVNDIGPMARAFERLIATHGGPPPVEVLVSTLADIEFRRVRGLAAVYVEMGAVAYAGHPLLRSLLAASLQNATDLDDPASLGSLYRMLLGHYGWELREGAEWRDLVVAFYAQIQGSLFVHRVWPEGIADDIPWEGGTRSAFSLAAEGILRQFAQPIEP
jgi:hypothetical protein